MRSSTRCVRRLQVTNATSTPAGTRSYEFQIGDTPEFSSAAVLNIRNIPEGAGQTSLSVDNELLPVTRYYWRARAVQSGTNGPWSPTMRFRTRVQSFKSGNQVFDVLTNFTTVANDSRGIAYFGPNDVLPGAKLDDEDSYLSYRLTAPMPEGKCRSSPARSRAATPPTGPSSARPRSSPCRTAAAARAATRSGSSSRSSAPPKPGS